MSLHCSFLLIIAVLAQGSTDTATDEQPQVACDCPITKTIESEPLKDPNAMPFGFGAYHVNEDRSIWLRSRRWIARRGDKGIWIRPQGTQLVVSGRRLDAEAPPLEVVIPCCYPTGFQVTGMTFPTEGCWEVRARAGKKKLRFVVVVEPAQDKASSHQ